MDNEHTGHAFRKRLQNEKRWAPYTRGMDEMLLIVALDDDWTVVVVERT